MAIERTEKAVLEIVDVSTRRLTPQYLEKTIIEKYGLDKPRAKAVLKDLVARGQLEYTYEFGSTYLVRSFNKPVRISPHVVVKPPGYRYEPAPDEVVIQIKPGAAFGGGRHPTTRLSVKAIDFLFKEWRPDWQKENCSVLDVGTGSGILAIAAVCLGINKGLAIDIDPCARSEAVRNVDLNGLAGRIRIDGSDIAAQKERYALVVANLRRPTLASYRDRIAGCVRPGGMLIISGIKVEEREDIETSYTVRGMAVSKCWDEKEWAAMLMRKAGGERMP